jgi:hypothetical protein
MENSKSQLSNTGYKGIHFDKSKGKFETQVYLKGIYRSTCKSFYVGVYETLKEAIKAREEFIKSLF